MNTEFLLLFIAFVISTCYNIFLLWYIQKNIWKKEIRRNVRYNTMKRKPKIVKRVDVRATLLSIKIGESPEFTEFQMSSNNASSIATNLKKKVGLNSNLKL